MLQQTKKMGNKNRKMIKVAIDKENGGEINRKMIEVAINVKSSQWRWRWLSGKGVDLVISVTRIRAPKATHHGAPEDPHDVHILNQH